MFLIWMHTRQEAYQAGVLLGMMHAGQEVYQVGCLPGRMYTLKLTLSTVSI